MFVKGISISAMLLAGLMLAACGNGAGGGNTPVLMSAPVVTDGEGFVINGAPLPNFDYVRTGDAIGNGDYAGVLAFDLNGVGSVIQAVLTFHQITTFGDPWALGPLQVEHIDGGGILDATDATSPALAGVATVGDLPMWTVDVTAQVAADVAAGRTTSTFRLRMDTPTDGDGGLDYMDVAASVHPDPNARPTLVISFTP